MDCRMIGREQQAVGIGVAGRVLVGKLADGLVDEARWHPQSVHRLGRSGDRWNDQLRVRSIVQARGLYRSLAGE